MPPLAASGSNSSDYFEPDDPEFLHALQTATLPGDIPPLAVPVVACGSDAVQEQLARTSLKRSRSISDGQDIPQSTTHRHDSLGQEEDTYGPSHFGQFGEYMRRKRAKLQIQNAELEEPVEAAVAGKIFRGLAIYINGWTEPSVQDLRQLIIRHGGIFHPYLDKKALVTHIITCSLTPAKIREFKYMKIVRPEWLVESAKTGVLLPWKDFIFRPTERLESTQGTKTGQKTLYDGVVPLSRLETSTNEYKPSSEAMTTSDAPESLTMDEDSTAQLNPWPSTPPPQEDKSHLNKPSASTTTSTSTSPVHPLYTADPKNAIEAAPVPGYAAHTSNPNAQRAMANPEWRSAHTSVAPDFIEGYYKNSRLHHLATWKAELRNLVQEAQEHAEATSVKLDGVVEKIASEDVHMGGLPAESGVSMRGAELVMRSPSKGKGKAKAGDPWEDRVIMHCDFDCFFVSAGLVNRPHLRGKPVVVCHSQGAQGGSTSTSEIASSSYEARTFGIKNGMSLQQARKLCPAIVTIPYEFERYKQFSLQFYTILMSHADDLQAVSVDEALIDVTTSVACLELGSTPPSSIHPAKALAETIRAEVKKSTGCEVSIGISHNILLARLATRRAKPASSYHLVLADVPEFLAPLDIANLHGFGHSTKQKAQDKLGVTTLGELAKMSKGSLCDALGKTTGETLYKAVRGIDDKKLESDKPRKSVSCEINYGIRFENNEQAETFIYQMAEEVTKRLNEVDMLGRLITLKIMKRDPTAPVEPPKFLGHGSCDLFNKQMPLVGPGGRATNDDKVIGEHAWRLLKSFNFDPTELRGIGIQIQKLESSSAAANADPGQATLPFKPVESPTKPPHRVAGDLQIIVHPPSLGDGETAEGNQNIPGPSRSSNVLELPSFSQIDMGVFDALPEDLRKELEDEYKRRSISPIPVEITAPPPPAQARPLGPPVVFPRKITVKGTNLKRITQQLAPRNRPTISPKKNTLFAKRDGPSSLRMSDAELRKLDIDPEVFAILPVDLQREQLLRARLLKTNGTIPIPVGKRKILKPYRPSRSPSYRIRRRPPPKANHPQPPFLKQQGQQKGEKLYFMETDDVQRVIEKWVNGFREHPPNQKDVSYFAKWLTQSVDSSRSTDVGVEKAVAVVKWWLVLLRRYWGSCEQTEDMGYEAGGGSEDMDSDVVGNAWWDAFRDVKEQMDLVARKKFGGRLSLR